MLVERLEAFEVEKYSGLNVPNGTAAFAAVFVPVQPEGEDHV